MNARPVDSFLGFSRRRCLILLVLFCALVQSGLAGVGGPAGIVLYHREGESVFLLLADHQLPSKRGWGGFGGKHEADETPAQTAARETEEETRGFFKRADLLQKIKDQTPFEDGEFSLFFAEIEAVPTEKIASHPIPDGEKSFRERGPWAWIPLSEVLQHLRGEPQPNTVALINPALLPAGTGARHFWPVWLHNMHRALKAGVLPWMKAPEASAKSAQAEVVTPQR